VTGDEPSNVRVTVIADGRPPRQARSYRGRTLAVAGALTAAVAAVLIATGSGSRDHTRRAAARAPGPRGVAAAYGYPLRCLSVAIALHDPRFARADFDHAVPCGRYTGEVTAIFRRADGAWVPVLDAASYPCPVRSLPEQVQVELGVCLPPTAAYADTPDSVGRARPGSSRVSAATRTRSTASSPSASSNAGA
jgi:hypothetical protein